MNNRKERGAIVVEATLSLTTFVFALFMIITLVDIAYLQYKMAIAMNAATKEISQYSCLYYKFNLDDVEAKYQGGAAEAKQTADDTLEGVESVLTNIGGVKEGMSSADFDAIVNNLKGAGATASETVEDLADAISKDPKGFLKGMGSLAISELGEKGKSLLGQALAKAFMKKNLRASEVQDADSFLILRGVEDGMAGLDFTYTTLMPYGSNSIDIVVTYEVSVLKLLNTDFAFKFRQMSKGAAWGKGMSKLDPPNVWNTMGAFERGAYIVAEERKKYSYRSSGYGFDAFDNSGGKNQFVSIISINNSNVSYQKQSAYNEALKKSFSKMKKGVEKLGDPITVSDTDGNDVSVKSNPSTRTYKLEVVLPDGAGDSAKEMVNTAYEKLKQENPGCKIELVIKEGYGSATPPAKEE